MSTFATSQNIWPAAAELSGADKMASAATLATTRKERATTTRDAHTLFLASIAQLLVKANVTFI